MEADDANNKDKFSDLRVATPTQTAAPREPDDIDAMLEGHTSPIKASLTESTPLVMASTPAAAAAPPAESKRQPVLRKQPSVSPSPNPATSKGRPVQANASTLLSAKPAPIEAVARKPAIPTMRTKRTSPPRPQLGEKTSHDPASEASRMAHLSARERVDLGLRQLRAQQDRRPSSAFATSTPRTSFGLVLDHTAKTPQQVKKEQLAEERLEKVLRQVGGPRSHSAAGGGGATTTRSLSSHQQYERQGSWARDTVVRGLYNYSWSKLPQTVPRKHADPSPGPGAYTPALYFVGARV